MAIRQGFFFVFGQTLTLSPSHRGGRPQKFGWGGQPLPPPQPPPPSRPFLIQNSLDEISHREKEENFNLI